jgi:hypothetical protein
MKKENVPQDLLYYKDSVVSDITYAVDENGQYVVAVSEGWSVKNDAVGAVWEDLREQCEEIRQQVLAGKVSPLAYHIKKSLLDVKMLSAYSGVSKWKIRRHLKYDKFMKLDEKTLQKYAYVMHLTIDELKRVDEWK